MSNNLSSLQDIFLGAPDCADFKISERSQATRFLNISVENYIFGNYIFYPDCMDMI